MRELLLRVVRMRMTTTTRLWKMVLVDGRQWKRLLEAAVAGLKLLLVRHFWSD